ncbi:MAG TPA: hypothetical protein VM870_00600 [Pyrinomonadaceae bacterium]|jgi:hypothetical protein|nr:hypothetical protein [Pyrinomonadaceae bacterium]
MSDPADRRTEEASGGPPSLQRDARGAVAPASLVGVIGWFLDYDSRVAMMRHSSVEELFQWKQRQSPPSGEETFVFDSAEDRLAIGIAQALEIYRDEAALHGWLADLLGALDESSKLNEEISAAYKLRTEEGASALAEAAKIPNVREREFYLTACWLEALCTAEARVLGWIYQELYGRAFRPDNFSH